MEIYPDKRIYRFKCACLGCDETVSSSERCHHCEIANCEYEGFCVKKRYLFDLFCRSHRAQAVESLLPHINRQKRFTPACSCGLISKSHHNLTVQQCKKYHDNHIDKVFNDYYESRTTVQITSTLKYATSNV